MSSIPDQAPPGVPDPEGAATGTERPGGRRARSWRPPTERELVCGVSLLAMCALMLTGMLMPVPYVVESPGPAVDVLGQYEGKDVLSISGATTYPTDGALMMTTVSVDGGPGTTVTPAEVAWAWFDRSQSVLPSELVFPPDSTREQTALENAVQMSTSQQTAIAAALDELGTPYTRTVMVAGVEEGGPADGVLRAGDVVLAINGESRESVEDYQQITRSAPAGEDIAMRVLRDGHEQDLEVPTHQVDGTTRMGIVLARGYDFPLDVRVNVEGIGGPSAGTMFALAIYDELTPGALAGGERIAGTGTIDEDRKVGPIGGIRQKLIGARDQRARYFLVPADNCDEVIGHVPDGLTIVRIATFEDAIAAVTQIGTTHSADGLPTCQKP